MTSKIENYKMICDFCRQKYKFEEIKQVPLRIDKNSKYQYLFGDICEGCVDDGAKKTLNNQSVKKWQGRSKSTNERSVFDEGENDG